MIKNIVCIDPGVHGGFAFNDGERVFTMNMPTMPTGCKSATFTDLQVEKLYDIIDGLPNNQIWIEKVGPRPSDTPKTAWRFSANYHCLLMALQHRGGPPVKMQLPQHWQAQLGISLPTGAHNYDRRKKILKDFATKKFPDVTRIGQTPTGRCKGEWRD